MYKLNTKARRIFNWSNYYFKSNIMKHTWYSISIYPILYLIYIYIYTKVNINSNIHQSCSFIYFIQFHTPRVMHRNIFMLFFYDTDKYVPSTFQLKRKLGTYDKLNCFKTYIDLVPLPYSTDFKLTSKTFV